MINNKDYAPIVLFSKINFSQMKSASFIEANLSKARFTYSILKNVNFVDPIWKIAKDGRKIIYDESVPVIDTTDEEILREYVQLKYNYEENRDYPSAGDWYYREAECRKRIALADKEKGIFKRIKNIFVRNTFILYKFVSEYGENYTRPFFLLVVVCLLFAFFYQLNGFDLNGKLIDYDWCWSCGFNWANIEDYGNALLFSVGAMLFQVGRGLKLTSSTSYFFYAFHLLLTIIIVPLFLLALRRKFRR